MYINNILISDGDTPLILLACPIDLGFISVSFSFPSVEIECNF